MTRCSCDDTESQTQQANDELIGFTLTSPVSTFTFPCGAFIHYIKMKMFAGGLLLQGESIVSGHVLNSPILNPTGVLKVKMVYGPLERITFNLALSQKSKQQLISTVRKYWIRKLQLIL